MRPVILACIAVCLVSCEVPPTETLMMDPPEGVEQVRLIPPDLRFRLTEAEIQRLQPMLDVRALERLLGHIRPEYRGEWLELFSVGSGPHVLVPDDPFIAALLEPVYEPQWEEARRVDARIADILKRLGKYEPDGE